VKKQKKERNTFFLSFYSKTNQMHQYLKYILCGMTLYMFRTVSPSIISSSRLYIQLSNRYCCLLAYFRMTLYMFRTVFPSIIISSRLYIQQQAYVKQTLPPASSRQCLPVSRYTTQQAHRQPVTTEHRTTHTQHMTCCHSTKL